MLADLLIVIGAVLLSAGLVGIGGRVYTALRRSRAG